MTTLYIQDHDGKEIYQEQVQGAAPMVLSFEGVYYYRRNLRKFGDATYRPASFRYVTRRAAP
jgi:hypothetical protein